MAKVQRKHKLGLGSARPEAFASTRKAEVRSLGPCGEAYGVAVESTQRDGMEDGFKKRTRNHECFQQSLIHFFYT